MLARALATLPSPCEICRRWTSGGAAALCADCMARFAAPRPRCARCGLGLGVAATACGACLAEPPPFDATVCAVDYAFPWDRLIGAFKFQERVELAGCFARLLQRALRGHGAQALRLLPLPLSPARLRQRGYDQAALLARALARRGGWALDEGRLLRLLDTPAQSALDRRARQRNLRGAFYVEPGRREALAGQTLALVDDVMTTGATLAAAAQVLRRAGAARIECWVFARTPPPHEAAAARPAA